jgi:NhaA family Na+:H+ antiporter
LRVGIGRWEIDESLVHWINDGLMTIFFFVVGLEIKREIVDGELNDPRKAALPLMAALGGMIAPAVLYLMLISGEASGRSGWGIEAKGLALQKARTIRCNSSGVSIPCARR